MQTIFDLLVSRTLASLRVRLVKNAVFAREIIEAGASVRIDLLLIGSRVRWRHTAPTPVSTDSRIPTVFNTASKVLSVGLPLGDSAR